MTQHIAQLEKQPAIQTTKPLTLEHFLYAAVLLAAIVFRFVGLGAEPLSPVESAAAWPAWLAATQTSVAGAPAPVSALLYGIQSLLFWIVGGSDVLARFAPALVSTATVMLPWYWRKWLGRWAALTVAVLFAVDPWLTAWGRRADGGAIALFLGLLVLTALWHWRHDPDADKAGRWERVGAVALALLLTSGPLAWGMLPVLFIFTAIYIWPGSERATLPVGRISSLVWFGVALAVGATGFALRPEAVGALSTSLSRWFAALAGEAVNNPLAWPFVRLLIDQPLLALFGPIGLAVLSLDTRRREHSSLALFLWLWLGWGLLLWLLPGRDPMLLPVVGIPLAFCVGMLSERVATTQAERLTGLELLALLTVQIVLVVAAAIWLVALAESPVFNDQLWLTSIVIVGLAVIVWVIYGFWVGWTSMARLAFMFYGLLLLGMTVRSSWLLNQTQGLMQPDGLWPAVTSGDVRLLVQDVERLSSARSGDPNQAEMQVVYDVRPDPVLGWYLREMRSMQQVGAIDAAAVQAAALSNPAGPNWPLIVAPSGRNATLALPDPYIGSDYDTTIRWDMTMLPQPPAEDMTDELSGQKAQGRWSEFLRPRLRWLMYRTVTEPPAVETVTLWTAR